MWNAVAGNVVAGNVVAGNVVECVVGSSRLLLRSTPGRTLAFIMGIALESFKLSSES